MLPINFLSYFLLIYLYLPSMKIEDPSSEVIDFSQTNSNSDMRVFPFDFKSKTNLNNRLTYCVYSSLRYFAFGMLLH